MKQWVNNKMVPFFNKLGNQRHLSAIRDSFGLITPIAIAGSVGILILAMVFGGWGAQQTSILGLLYKWTGHTGGFTGKWLQFSTIGTNVFGALNSGSMNIMTLTFVFGLGYFLSRSRGNDFALMGGLVAQIAFAISVQGSYGAAGGGVPSYFTANGLITGIIIGIISTEIYCKLSSWKKLLITLPDGVPPAVARSLAKLFPVILTLLAITFMYAVVAIPTYYCDAPIQSVKNYEVSNVVISQTVYTGMWSLGDMFYYVIQSPFLDFAQNSDANLGIALVFVLCVQLLWFFGIHGSNVMNGIFVPIFSALFYHNLLCLGLDPVTGMATSNTFGLTKGDMVIFSGTEMFPFIMLGGSVPTLPLIMSSFAFSKREEEKAVAAFAAPAGAFNINEPVVFGYPLVANPIYLVPLLTVGPTLVLTTWLGYTLFPITLPFINVPWTATPGFGALMATGFDYSAFLLFAFNFGIAFLMWTPFVILNNKIKAKADAAEGVKPVKELSKKEKKAKQLIWRKVKWGRAASTFGVVTFFGLFLIAISFTFGDGVTGRVFATLEGLFIVGTGAFVAFGAQIKYFIRKNILSKLDKKATK